MMKALKNDKLVKSGKRIKMQRLPDDLGFSLRPEYKKTRELPEDLGFIDRAQLLAAQADNIVRFFWSRLLLIFHNGNLASNLPTLAELIKSAKFPLQNCQIFLIRLAREILGQILFCKNCQEYFPK
jgi:hypothetical protein